MADFPKLARIKQDDENMEKLHCAARRGQTELIRRLVSTNISPTIANKFGCTALHLSCKHGHVSATRELAPQSDPFATWHGQRPLSLAIHSGNQEVVQVLIESIKEAGKPIEGFVNDCDEYHIQEIGRFQKDIHGQTATHMCVGNEDIPMLQLLLSLGASPTSKDRAGETPIMRAIEFGLPEIFKILVNSVPQNNLRLDICDKQGRSHLHWALMHNQPEMAQTLLDLGHDVNIEDGEKVTPFLLAANCGQPHLLDQMLNDADQFLFQSAQFHNGIAVQPERIPWMTFAEEAGKVEVLKILQKKLDALNKERGVTAQPAATGKKAAPIQVAPSAPIKK